MGQNSYSCFYFCCENANIVSFVRIQHTILPPKKFGHPDDSRSKMTLIWLSLFVIRKLFLLPFGIKFDFRLMLIAFFWKMCAFERWTAIVCLWERQNSKGGDLCSSWSFAQKYEYMHGVYHMHTPSSLFMQGSSFWRCFRWTRRIPGRRCARNSSNTGWNRSPFKACENRGP